MSAVFKMGSSLFKFQATADIPAGAIVKLSDCLIGITSSSTPAGKEGWAASMGEYIVDVTPGTAYAVGELVTAPAITPAGVSTTAVIGPATAPVTTADTTARVRFMGVRYNAPTSAET